MDVFYVFIKENNSLIPKALVLCVPKNKQFLELFQKKRKKKKRRHTLVD